ncbi:MAG: TatD family hydrolase [Methanomassiliicoccales archaeon]|jgi:TatD-related deoxyribonuclease|nr:TatD family hydrolase [Methanomassiliicoccales archaeon]
MRIPVFDNHIHLRPSGRNIDALREFRKVGGTHAILVHLPYDEIKIVDEESFERSFDIAVNIANKARKEVDVGLDLVVGPYPALIIPLAEMYGINRAVEIMRGGMEIAQRFVREQKAVGIGEIGRPHFPISEEILKASNDVLKYGMELAADIDCPVILHTESVTPETMKEIASMADAAGLRRERVVKHYCPPYVLPEENHGLFPSILASREAIREAIKKGRRFLMETDYLDDPNRPGAVMAITTVPKRSYSFLQSGVFTEDDLWRIHKENPEKVYGLTID